VPDVSTVSNCEGAVMRNSGRAREIRSARGRSRMEHRLPGWGAGGNKGWRVFRYRYQVALRVWFLAFIPLVGSCTALMPSLPEISAAAGSTLNFLDRGISAGDGGDKFSPTSRMSLSAEQMVALQAVVRQAFPGGWAIRFRSVKAGRAAVGDMAICGLVTARDSTSTPIRPYLFRVEAPAPGNQAPVKFLLKEISQTRTEQLVIYSHCNALGLT